MTGPDPEITPDPSGPPQGESEARDALRDRIAHAILKRADEQGTAVFWGDLADAVLPVVEAETGALTHLLRRTEDELHEARTRAEKAERERDAALAEMEKAVRGAALAINLAGRQAEKDRTRAEQAEAAVQRARDLAEDRIAVPSHVLLAALDQPEAAP